MSQSVSPQVLVKTETIANLERIIEHVDSVPQKFDRRQPRSTRRNLYTADWTGSIQNPSRVQWIHWTGSEVGSGPVHPVSTLTTTTTTCSLGRLG
jgi:hypothetical protein